MSSFGSACGDDKPSTTSESGGQTETSAATEASTMAASTTDASTTRDPATSEPTTGETGDASTGTTVDTSDTGSEGTGGELPDCSVFDGDMAACQAMVGCVWEYEAELCFVDCTMLLDQATCEKAMICSWFDSVCYPPI